MQKRGPETFTANRYYGPQVFRLSGLHAWLSAVLRRQLRFLDGSERLRKSLCLHRIAEKNKICDAPTNPWRTFMRCILLSRMRMQSR